MSPCREQRKKCEQEHYRARVAQHSQLHLYNANKSALYNAKSYGTDEIRIIMFMGLY